MSLEPRIAVYGPRARATLVVQELVAAGFKAQVDTASHPSTGLSAPSRIFLLDDSSPRLQEAATTWAKQNEIPLDTVHDSTAILDLLTAPMHVPAVNVPATVAKIIAASPDLARNARWTRRSAEQEEQFRALVLATLVEPWRGAPLYKDAHSRDQVSKIIRPALGIRFEGRTCVVDLSTYHPIHAASGLPEPTWPSKGVRLLTRDAPAQKPAKRSRQESAQQAPAVPLDTAAVVRTIKSNPALSARYTRMVNKETFVSLVRSVLQAPWLTREAMKLPRTSTMRADLYLVRAQAGIHFGHGIMGGKGGLTSIDLAKFRALHKVSGFDEPAWPSRVKKLLRVNNVGESLPIPTDKEVAAELAAFAKRNNLLPPPGAAADVPAPSWPPARSHLAARKSVPVRRTIVITLPLRDGDSMFATIPCDVTLAEVEYICAALRGFATS